MWFVFTFLFFPFIAESSKRHNTCMPFVLQWRQLMYILLPNKEQFNEIWVLTSCSNLLFIHFMLACVKVRAKYLMMFPWFHTQIFTHKYLYAYSRLTKCYLISKVHHWNWICGHRCTAVYRSYASPSRNYLWFCIFWSIFKNISIVKINLFTKWLNMTLKKILYVRIFLHMLDYTCAGISHICKIKFQRNTRVF